MRIRYNASDKRHRKILKKLFCYEKILNKLQESGKRMRPCKPVLYCAICRSFSKQMFYTYIYIAVPGFQQLPHLRSDQADTRG